MTKDAIYTYYLITGMISGIGAFGIGNIIWPLEQGLGLIFGSSLYLVAGFILWNWDDKIQEWVGIK